MTARTNTDIAAFIEKNSKKYGIQKVATSLKDFGTLIFHILNNKS
ncbi:MAG: hypothetical protein ACTSO7_00955 [Candidatus Heimdallarchaeota archaeon]